ncbi:MAG: hypothetical protein AB7F36_04015 [Reyranellaceae bacterium]
MRITGTIAALLLAAVAGAPARGQAPDLRDLRILIGAQHEYEERKIDSGEEPFRTRFQSTIWLEAVQGKLVWLGHVFGCMDPDRPDMSLIYARGNFAGDTECPAYRIGTESDWTERSAEASYRTRMDVKGNVLTLSGEMSGTYSSETLHCGRAEWLTDGAFTVTQSLSFRLTGQTCEVISAQVVVKEDETDEDDERKIVTRISTAGPGSSCKVVRRSEPVPDTAEKLVRFDQRC